LAVGLLAAALVCQAAYVGLLAAANGAAARLTRDGDVDAGDSYIALLYSNTLETPLALLRLVVVATMLIGLVALADAVRRSKLIPATIAVAAFLTLVVDFGLPYVLLAPAWAWIGWKILRRERLPFGRYQLRDRHAEACDSVVAVNRLERRSDLRRRPQDGISREQLSQPGDVPRLGGRDEGT
jgi:hypothetical protein